MTWSKGSPRISAGARSHTPRSSRRRLQIPAVVGLRDVFNHVNPGDMVIVDGGEGLVIINPALSTLENYRKVREIQYSPKIAIF